MSEFVFFSLTCALTMFFMTKLAIRLSKKLNFYDVPNERNDHDKPIPILGGVALLVSLFLNMALIIKWELSPFVIGLIGAVAIFLVGLYDDKFKLSPMIKIALQCLVISILFMNGVKIEFITIPAYDSPFFFTGGVSFFITQVWMLILINTFNIIDGIDGLSTGVSFVTAIGLFVVSLNASPIIISYLLCAIIGSTGMFLRFNFYPAKIFLGDSGALLLGYLFGLISILGVLKSAVSFMVLVFIFAVPLMDLILSILRRLLKRKNIFYPDLEHMHHQLIKRGISIRKTSLLLYIVSAFFGLIAIFSAADSTILKNIIGLFLFFIVSVWFFKLQSFKNKA